LVLVCTICILIFSQIHQQTKQLMSLAKPSRPKLIKLFQNPSSSMYMCMYVLSLSSPVDGGGSWWLPSTGTPSGRHGWGCRRGHTSHSTTQDGRYDPGGQGSTPQSDWTLRTELAERTHNIICIHVQSFKSINY